MTTTVTFNQNKVEADESPFEMTEGEKRYFVCNYWGVPSSVSVTAYRSTSGSGNGIAATIFATDDVTVSGNSAALPVCGGPNKLLTGRAEYIVNVTATISSEIFVKYFKIRVRRDEAM